MSIKVPADSPLPAVAALRDKLAANGQMLEYASVDTTGRVLGYQPAGGMLVIMPPIGTDLSNMGDDPARFISGQFMPDQYSQFALRPSDPRMMWYGLGIVGLLMTLLYTRGKK
jgi:hypothetical protein